MHGKCAACYYLVGRKSYCLATQEDVLISTSSLSRHAVGDAHKYQNVSEPTHIHTTYDQFNDILTVRLVISKILLSEITHCFDEKNPAETPN